MANRDIVVIGASAGGVQALQQVFRKLPASLSAAFMVVLHTSNHSGSSLPAILSSCSKLPACHPSDGEKFDFGRIYIAPPDYHMTVEGDRLRIHKGARENWHRPAIDPLFRSAASVYGPRVVGVILSGALDDGTSGLMEVRAHGGAAVIQSPASAMFSSMPKSAMARVPDAHVLPLEEISDAIVRLTSEPVNADKRAAVHHSRAAAETRITGLDMSEIRKETHPGEPSGFGCPECGGVLWEIDQHGLLRYRCRIGHAYTARYLRSAQRRSVESALWAALRALEENASLCRRLAQRAQKGEHNRAATLYSERSETSEQNARVLRDLLVRISSTEGETDDLDAAV